MFYEKELQKRNQTQFSVENLIKKKGNKLHVKWKGYDHSFDSWIDKTRYCYIKRDIFQNHIVTVKTK